jgi:hypothetical protein
MITEYNRWREIKSVFSRLWNVIWHRGTADIPLSARAYLEDMPQKNGIDRFFYWRRKEENHCRNWAYVESHCAREIVRKAIERGLLEE